MSDVADLLAALSGVAATLIASFVWWRDRQDKRGRQARNVSAWVVREDRKDDANKDWRGVVVQNLSDAPLSRVGIQMEKLTGDKSSNSPTYELDGAGQLYAQIPPGSYYLQRRTDDEAQAWSAPLPISQVDGELRATIDDERVDLTPVTEVHAGYRLNFLSFRDTSNNAWWRVGMGTLTSDKPRGWNEDSLLRTAEAPLPRAQPRRGANAQTESIAVLLREAVNEVVEPSKQVNPVERRKWDVPLTGSTHALAGSVKSFGLAGGTGMGLRLSTHASTDRNDNLYYLEGNRDGRLPAQFFYGRVTPDKKNDDLRDALVAAGPGTRRAADWTPAELVKALTKVIGDHQANLAARR